MLLNIIFLSLLGFTNSTFLECSDINTFNKCIDSPYCIWCLENNYTTNYTCLEYNYCTSDYPGINCTSNKNRLKQIGYCNIFTLFYFIVVLIMQYLISSIIVLLMTKILYPDGILTSSERNIMYFLGTVVVLTGLTFWFFFFNYILDYVLIVFSIIFTLMLIYVMMKYRNENNSSLPSYEAINYETES